MEAREEEEDGEHTGTGTYRILFERQSQRNETSNMLNLVLSLRATMFGVNGKWREWWAANGKPKRFRILNEQRERMRKEEWLE